MNSDKKPSSSTEVRLVKQITFPSVGCGSLKDTFAQVLVEEERLVNEMDVESNDFLKFALVAYQISDGFLKRVKRDAWAFPVFLNQVRNHAGLAILAVARRHHVQAMFSLRQVLEAGSWAAYGLANFEKEKFMEMQSPDNVPSVPDSLKKNRNKWLELHFKEGSDKVKIMKKHIDETTAHSNIVYAFQNYDYNKLTFHFFDTENEVDTTSDLYFIGLGLFQLMDLFYGVNKLSDTIEFSDDFLPNMKMLKNMIDSLKSRASEEVATRGI